MIDLRGRRGPLRRRILVGVVVTLLGAGVVTAAMLPFREALAATAVGLVFVVPVVVATALAGVPGAVAGVLGGFLAFNVLFIEPYRTVKVGNASDVITLGAFVVVGAISSVTVVLQRRAEEEAQHRAEEARTLVELSRSLITPGSLEEVLTTVVGQVHALFDLRTTAVLAPADGGLQVAAWEGERVDAEVVQLLDELDGDAATGEVIPGWWAAALRVNDSVNGFFVTSGVVHGEDLEVLRTFANQTALAVQRTRLAERATQAQVLEEVDRLRTALIRSVSHDLRTPLAAVRAAADDLGDPHLRLSEQDRRVLAQTIGEEAERLDRLVDNLLDMSRVEAGELTLEVEAVDLDELVTAVADRYGRQVRTELPAGSLALIDPVLVEQVLDNLVHNVLRHAGDSAIPLVRVTHRPGMLQVSVIDHGPGIPEPDRERVFDIFHRGGGGPGTADGTGLGLAICRGYVEAHDGEIWIEETPGGGATVSFTVPAAAAAPAEIGPPAGRQS